MYIMDISILGFKLNLEILILIGVVYLILVGHTLCGCCNFGMMEGLDTMKATNPTAPVPSPAPTTMTKPKEGSTKANGSGKEGFVGANTNYGQSSPYDLTSQQSINTSSWSNPNMTVIPGHPLSQGVKDFLAREPQPVPLPEGEMLLFANTPFKPECCPNTYSNSTGCACMTGNQYNYLMLRGGNNVPYSEY
jgi:hypothetical protein